MSATGSFGGAASAAGEESSDLAAAAGVEAAECAEAAELPLDAEELDFAATPGLKGGGASGPFPELRRVPSITSFLMDCGGGKNPALCPKSAHTQLVTSLSISSPVHVHHPSPAVQSLQLQK